MMLGRLPAFLTYITCRMTFQCGAAPRIDTAPDCLAVSPRASFLLPVARVPAPAAFVAVGAFSFGGV